MKKILLLVTALFVTALSSKAQDTVVVADTVHYFFNKHYFKTGDALDKFHYYKSAASTTTRVTHIGSKFENTEPIVIKGLEAFLAWNINSTNESVPVRLYLCTLDVAGKPFFPPLDSILVPVTGGTVFGAPQGSLFPEGRTHTLTTDFAVLLRNVSLYSGDTVHVLRTNGKTNGNVNADPKDKNSDGFGFVRFAGKFYSTSDFPSSLPAGDRIHAPGFSPKTQPNMPEYTGTSYEFCIAPIVQYTLVSHHTPNAKATQTLCVWEPAVYTSHSSKRFLQRQYNLVEFARYWNRGALFAANTLSLNNSPVFPSDSSIGWYFSPEDCYEPPGSGWQCNPEDPRLFLHYLTTTNQVTFMTDSALGKKLSGADSLTCFPNSEFRTRFKSMAIYGRGVYHTYNDTFLVCTSRCGVQMNVGVREYGDLTHVRVYPNPASGDITVSGLGSGAIVSVYDITGQLVARKPASAEVVEMDLRELAPGLYHVRVAEGDRWRSVKLLKQ